MAFTKLYLTNTAAPYTPATIRGAWDDAAGAVTKALDPNPYGAGLNTVVSRAEANASTTYDVLLYRGVSGPLAAQTIGGDINVVIPANESASDADLFWHLHVYVTQGDSDTPRGDLLTDYVESTTNEWPTARTVLALQSAQALAALAVSDGDRIVVELGYIARNSLTSSRTGTLAYGTLNSSNQVIADQSVGSTAAADPGYLTFSSSLADLSTARVSQLVAELAEADAAPAARVSQFGVELAESNPAGLARVSQLGLEVAADAGISPQRVSQFAVEIAAAPAVNVRVTNFGIEIISENRTPFPNGVLLVGLTWIIVTLRGSGTQYVWSDRPLPDPSWYYLGWKEPRVVKWGRIRRALSSVLDGQYETTDFNLTLDDNDHLLRSLEDGLLNATVACYMITDRGRRLLETPTTVYRGVIRDAKPTGTLQYDLTIKDPFAEVFALGNNSTNLLPRRTINADDFANCAQPLVNSSAEHYVVDGAVTAGVSPAVTRIPVRGGWGVFSVGDKVVVHSATYLVTESSLHNEWIGSPDRMTSNGDTETWIEIDRELSGSLSDGDAVVQVPMHAVNSSLGQRVPFPYGFITDLQMVDGVDQGDGQGPVVYVGDKVLPDGKTYAEFLWAGWACYSPSGRPFAMLYFWNNPLDETGSGTAFPAIGTLAEEADAGGRVVVPGYANWSSSNSFSTPYRDYHGRRYTVLYLRGIFRDWALGITAAPPNLGGAPFTVNAYGADTAADGSGSLITNILQQYKHAMKNICPPKGLGYQSGPWLDSPTFADDASVAMIDEASFDAADAQSAVYVTDGFRGDFIIGVNNESISARDLIARLNLSAGVQCGFNNRTQFFVSMVNTDLATTTIAPGLGWVRDIFAKHFAITPLTRELYTAIAFAHTPDYIGRQAGGWRSSGADDGITEVENTAAAADFGAKTTYETMQLPMLRGQPRSTDADDYARGQETIDAVLALVLARLSAVQHIPVLQTGPAGFEYELADVVPITHYEGYGEAGWIDEPVRIERTEIDPTEYVEEMEGYELAPMYPRAVVTLLSLGSGLHATTDQYMGCGIWFSLSLRANGGAPTTVTLVSSNPGLHADVVCTLDAADSALIATPDLYVYGMGQLLFVNTSVDLTGCTGVTFTLGPSSVLGHWDRNTDVLGRALPTLADETPVSVTVIP